MKSNQNRGPAVSMDSAIGTSCPQVLFRTGVRAMISVFVFLFPFLVNAAELQQQTVKAWVAYVQGANSRMQQRLRPGGHFLWIDEKPDWSSRVRNGEILVSPAGPRIPKRVPSGLIHDWIGAAFIPNATIDEVLSVCRDYEQYKDFYRPTVIDSKADIRDGPAFHSAPIAQSTALEDRFSMLLMNRALFLKTALDGDFESSYFQVDDHRWYSTARTTRMQEIQGYGEPGEHKLAEDDGRGLIWRLSSITRFEQRDGGVYVELEAMALSRDIPLSLRWVADPIIRRVSRDSLTTSLWQTGNAVHSNGALVMSADHKPAVSTRSSY